MSLEVRSATLPAPHIATRACKEQQTLQGCAAPDSATIGYIYDIARPSPVTTLFYYTAVMSILCLKVWHIINIFIQVMQ